MRTQPGANDNLLRRPEDAHSKRRNEPHGKHCDRDWSNLSFDQKQEHCAPLGSRGFTTTGYLLPHEFGGGLRRTTSILHRRDLPHSGSFGGQLDNYLADVGWRSPMLSNVSMPGKTARSSTNTKTARPLQWCRHCRARCNRPERFGARREERSTPRVFVHTGDIPPSRSSGKNTGRN